MARAPRSYQQVARAEAAAETRRRIIEVTRELLARAPLENVGLPAIAAQAGVARSTVYASFGSREGLLLAVAEDVLVRGGFDRLGQAFRHPDALQALELSLREGVRMYEKEHSVGRAILSLAAVDHDAAVAARRFNRGRAEGMLHLAARLKQQGLLRDDVSIEEAADILWVITSFDTFEQLYSERKLSAQDTWERLSAMARRALCRSA